MELDEFLLKVSLEHPVSIPERCYSRFDRMYYVLGELLGLSGYLLREPRTQETAIELYDRAQRHLGEAVTRGLMPVSAQEFAQEQNAKFREALSDANIRQAEMELDILDSGLRMLGLHFLIDCVQRRRDSRG